MDRSSVKEPVLTNAFTVVVLKDQNSNASATLDGQAGVVYFVTCANFM